MLRTHPHPAGGLRRQTMKGVAMGSAPSRNLWRFLAFIADFIGLAVMMAGLYGAVLLAAALAE